MVRERFVDVYVPVGGSGVGVVGAMFSLFGVVVGFAVVVAVAVSCTDFGPGSTIPTGEGCRPFCTATPTPTPRGVPAGAGAVR